VWDAHRVPSLSWPLLLAALLSSTALAAPTISFDADRFGHVYVRGETPVLRVTVRADADGFRGTLRLRARDAYRRPAGRDVERIVLDPFAATTRVFELKTRQLGHFAMTATLSGRGPRQTATTSIAIVPPVRDTPAAASAVGYFVYPQDGHVAAAPRIAKQMRRLGIRWVRLTFPWWRDDRVTAPDRSDPAWLDTATIEAWVDAFRAEDMEVLLVLFGTARWASPTADDVLIEGIPRWGLMAPDREAWLDVVQTLATRLAGRVRHWEIWNEPDIAPFWQSPASDFTTLLRDTATALRAVDPAARVVVNFVPDSADLDAFETEVLAAASEHIDVLGWHYGAAHTVETAKQFLPAMRPGAAIWDTEALGAPRRHVSQWLLERAAGAERIFPFVYHLPYEDAGSPWERFGRYPVNVDYTPRPDGVALRTLSDMVGDATTITNTAAGLGYGTFTASGACCAGTLVLADLNQPGVTWTGPPGVRLKIEVPKAVQRLHVTDLMGNTTTLGVRKGRARLRLMGVAAFVRGEPAEALTELRVARARVRRR
jgi:hypothetical protein